MRSRQWAPGELIFLWDYRDKPITQLAIALLRKPSAVQNKLQELSRRKNKPVLTKNVYGPAKNKYSFIGKRPDCDNLFLRSRLEANFYRYLKHIEKPAKILYEPQAFTFTEFGISRGTLSYIPDFKVISADGGYRWYETKGWLDRKSLTKLRRFKKYYPFEAAQLTVVLDGGQGTKSWLAIEKLGLRVLAFKQIRKVFQSKIPNWES